MQTNKRRSKFARSDHRAIATSLEAMKDLVVARGGYLHPAAGIEERDGVLRAVCNAPLESGQPLFVVPDELLIPLDGLPWTASEQILQLSGRPHSLSPDRAEMLDMFITIYNAAGKMDWINQQATILLSQDAELVAQLMLVRNEPLIAPPSPAAAFLETRSYSSKNAEAGLADKSCIMPLIDFVNHRFDAPHYLHGRGQLKVNVNYPQASNECFVNYGGCSDPLGLALGHGYIDPNSPYVHSTPFSIDLTGFGRLEVAGECLGSNHKANPPKVKFQEDGLTLSHLSGDVRSPHFLRMTLHLAINASAKRRGIAQPIIERTLIDLPAAILAANRDKLAAFRAYLATRPELPLASLLAEASLHQLANLEKVFAN